MELTRGGTLLFWLLLITIALAGFKLWIFSGDLSSPPPPSLTTTDWCCDTKTVEWMVFTCRLFATIAEWQLEGIDEGKGALFCVINSLSSALTWLVETTTGDEVGTLDDDKVEEELYVTTEAAVETGLAVVTGKTFFSDSWLSKSDRSNFLFFGSRLKDSLLLLLQPPPDVPLPPALFPSFKASYVKNAKQNVRESSSQSFPLFWLYACYYIDCKIIL